MREIWMMQPRFDKRTGSSPYSLAAQLRFRAGFDFLRLRAAVGEVDEALAAWWQTFSTATDAMREDLIAQAKEQLREQQRAQQRAAQTGKAAPKGHGVAQTAASQSAEESPASSADQPAKKRRRRKPLAEGEAFTAPADTQAAPDDAQASAPDADAAPKKRRRPRRRKPAGDATLGRDEAA